MSLQRGGYEHMKSADTEESKWFGNLEIATLDIATKTLLCWCFYRRKRGKQWTVMKWNLQPHLEDVAWEGVSRARPDSVPCKAK